MSSQTCALLSKTIVNDFKPKVIHYINIDYTASFTILSLLQLRLDFVVASLDYLDQVHTNFMAYSKFSSVNTDFRFSETVKSLLTLSVTRKSKELFDKPSSL